MTDTTAVFFSLALLNPFPSPSEVWVGCVAPALASTLVLTVDLDSPG